MVKPGGSAGVFDDEAFDVLPITGRGSSVLRLIVSFLIVSSHPVSRRMMISRGTKRLMSFMVLMLLILRMMFRPTK